MRRSTSRGSKERLGFCFCLAEPPARGILVPRPGIERAPPAVEMQSLNRSPRQAVFTGCHPSCWHGDQPIFGGSPTLETHSQKSHAALILPTGDHGSPLQYSCPENPMNGGAWWAVVHGVAKSWTRLSKFTFTFLHWRRKWQPTPVFLPGESKGQGSLVSCHLWGRTELDATEVT